MRADETDRVGADITATENPRGEQGRERNERPRELSQAKLLFKKRLHIAETQVSLYLN